MRLALVPPPVEEPLLRVEGLTKVFRSTKRLREDLGIKAVTDVSFTVGRGETVALVGETGCGKSTVARCSLRLIEPTAGRIEFDSIDLLQLSRSHLRELRRRMQIVFQDPYSSLDPRMSVGAIVQEPLVVHGIEREMGRLAHAAEALEAVGIAPALMHRKPHEFSGGQRQRIAIARALVMNPQFIVLDEPVSALDVSVQAQVLNLLRDLQKNLKLTYLFIVHDLAVARYLSHRIAVLYKGQIVELADTEQLFDRPLHPYTVALLSAIPRVDPTIAMKDRRIVLKGEVSTGEVATGCPFRDRCPIGSERDLCRDVAPDLVEEAPAHQVACHYPGELVLSQQQRGSGQGVIRDGRGHDAESSIPE